MKLIISNLNMLHLRFSTERYVVRCVDRCLMWVLCVDRGFLRLRCLDSPSCCFQIGRLKFNKVLQSMLYRIRAGLKKNRNEWLSLIRSFVNLYLNTVYTCEKFNYKKVIFIFLQRSQVQLPNSNISVLQSFFNVHMLTIRNDTPIN